MNSSGHSGNRAHLNDHAERRTRQASNPLTELPNRDGQPLGIPSYSDGVTRRKTPNPDEGADEVANGTTPATRADKYIRYDDPGSGMQQFEDDRDWHHDQRRAEGYDVCPECGIELGSSS